jgi:phosphoglycolate phosphatase
MQVAVSRVLADHKLPPVTEDDVRLFRGQGSKVTMARPSPSTAASSTAWR